MKTINTIILFLLIIFVSCLIFHTEKEHYKMEAERYRDAYVKVLKIMEELKVETIESLKFENGRVLRTYHAIKDKRRDQWMRDEI